jgi:prepilin-type processing-associated H-X9-DG protein/prepilin-type N-terminal cleavage/methylation domain-containing protein
MRHKAAFTLVELMAVIAIIAILIALLMPVLSRVQAFSQRVSCAANLRVLGQALTMYTQRYATYPGAFHWPCVGEGQPVAVWPTRLREFTGRDVRVFRCPARDDDCRWADDVPGAGPPASNLYAGFGYDVGEPLLPIEGRRFSYGYNTWGAIDALFTGDEFAARGLGMYVPLLSRGLAAPELRASRVRFPSEMIAIGDSTVGGETDFMIDTGSVLFEGEQTPFESPTPPGDVHSGGANILFCDGSVRWYLRAELCQIGPKTPAGGQMRRMWFYDHLPHFKDEQ